MRKQRGRGVRAKGTDVSVAARDTRIMDHRFGCRHVIRTTVILVTPDGEEVSAILRDISMSGAFVETRAKCWRPYLPVEFQLTGGSAGAEVQPRVAAMVVRSTSDGVALMFDFTKPALIASLNAAGESSGQNDMEWAVPRDIVL